MDFFHFPCYIGVKDGKGKWGDILNYIKATKENAEEIYKLVQNTITTIYPKYYPKEVVDFFCRLHSKENIEKDIESGNVGMLMDGVQLVGTGSCRDDHITRVYVDPAFQRRGYGSYIMQVLEDEIALRYDAAYLDASLPASHMYEKRGYVTVRHDRWEVENGGVLVYEIMRKNINSQFWKALEELVNSSEIVIDRPKGTAHPKYPDFIYKLDYGCLKDTASMDGAGIDVWVGTDERKQIDAVMCIVDLLKRDSEIKILIGCTEQEKEIVHQTHNESECMKGILIRR